MSIQVGIDITSLLYERGVSRYTRNLVTALRAESEINISLFGSSLRQHKRLQGYTQQLNPDESQAKNVIWRWPPKVLTWLWRFGLTPVSSALPSIDLFHSWDWLQPPDNNLPLVSTIHDLAMLHFPETAHPSILSAHRRSWEVLKKKQARLIAVSKATKKDLVELLGYPAYLIQVIHEALPVEFRDLSNQMSEERYEELVKKLQISKPFILFVGTREPRKNLKRLIQAWEPLQRDVELLIVGDAGWDETSQPDYAPHTPALRFLGKVSDEALTVLYAEASLFAYPSLYEGFGLPILEAFHHGTPVVTADRSGTLEVAGNAAELVDPESVESIRKGLVTVLTENMEQQRKRLQRMVIRQQMFSWKSVATQTIQVYQQVIQDHEA